MQSEPTVIIGAVLVALPSLVPVVGLIPGLAGHIAGGILSAVGIGLVAYLRSKVTPSKDAGTAG